MGPLLVPCAGTGGIPGVDLYVTDSEGNLTCLDELGRPLPFKADADGKVVVDLAACGSIDHLPVNVTAYEPDHATTTMFGLKLRAVAGDGDQDGDGQTLSPLPIPMAQYEYGLEDESRLTLTMPPCEEYGSSGGDAYVGAYVTNNKVGGNDRQMRRCSRHDRKLKLDVVQGRPFLVVAAIFLLDQEDSEPQLELLRLGFQEFPDGITSDTGRAVEPACDAGSSQECIATTACDRETCQSMEYSLFRAYNLPEESRSISGTAVAYAWGPERGMAFRGSVPVGLDIFAPVNDDDPDAPGAKDASGGSSELVFVKPPGLCDGGDQAGQGCRVVLAAGVEAEGTIDGTDDPATYPQESAIYFHMSNSPNEVPSNIPFHTFYVPEVLGATRDALTWACPGDTDVALVQILGRHRATGDPYVMNGVFAPPFAEGSPASGGSPENACGRSPEQITELGPLTIPKLGEEYGGLPADADLFTRVYTAGLTRPEGPSCDGYYHDDDPGGKLVECATNVKRSRILPIEEGSGATEGPPEELADVPGLGL